MQSKFFLFLDYLHPSLAFVVRLWYHYIGIRDYAIHARPRLLSIAIAVAIPLLAPNQLLPTWRDLFFLPVFL